MPVSLKIFGMGAQMALQSLFLSVGMMVITRVINSYGSNVVAAFTVGSNVQNLAVMLFSNFSFGFSVYVGQNFGAKNAERIKLGAVSYTHLDVYKRQVTAHINLPNDAAVAFHKKMGFHEVSETDGVLLMERAIEPEDPNAKRFTKAYLILAQDYEAAREHAATFVKEGTVV